jgi:erythromycin esterase-like protein
MLFPRTETDPMPAYTSAGDGNPPPPRSATAPGRWVSGVQGSFDRAVAGEAAHAEDPYKAIVERVGNARAVLIGEASDGTHEFYHERAEITQRLIAQKGFAAVAVEADWPDALRVNRYVTLLSLRAPRAVRHRDPHRSNPGDRTARADHIVG